jgi:hypothetical protein
MSYIMLCICIQSINEAVSNKSFRNFLLYMLIHPQPVCLFVGFKFPHFGRSDPQIKLGGPIGQIPVRRKSQKNKFSPFLKFLRIGFSVFHARCIFAFQLSNLK